MSDSPLSGLLHALDMDSEPTPADVMKPGQIHTYRGDSLDFPTGSIYGGQIVAQVVAAARKTVPQGRLPHSVHAYFTTPGDLRHGVCYDVDTLRDGHSFSPARSTPAGVASGAHRDRELRNGRPGRDELRDPAPDVPGLRACPARSACCALGRRKEPDGRLFCEQVAVGHPPRAGAGAAQKPDTSAEEDRREQSVWMRADASHLPEEQLQRIRTDQALQRALLATGCDQLMMEPALRRAGLSYLTPGIRFATIDHSMWWYGALDVTRWHLYVQDSPIAGHGRALCRARVYQDGDLVAEIAQEAMIRVPRPDEDPSGGTK